jgi:hypothetical protein
MAMYPGQRRESPIHNIRGGYKECLWKCRRLNPTIVRSETRRDHLC